MVSTLTVSLEPAAPAVVTKHPTCETCNDPWITYHAHPHKDGSWGVPSFDGGFRYYWVKPDIKTRCGWSCTCPRHRFHSGEACKHIRKVVGMVAKGERHDMPNLLWVELMKRRDFDTSGLYD